LNNAHALKCHQEGAECKKDCLKRHQATHGPQQRKLAFAPRPQSSPSFTPVPGTPLPTTPVPITPEPATPMHVTHVHTSPVPGPPVPQAPADQDVLLLPGAAKCQGFSPDVPAPFTSNWPFQAHGLVQNALPFVFNETGLRARACTGVTSFGRFACDQCAGLASCTVQEQYAMRASYPAESAALSHITNVWLTNAQLQCRHKHFKRQFDGKRFSIMNQTGLVSLAY
jgi:hypothetical protein